MKPIICSFFWFGIALTAFGRQNAISSVIVKGIVLSIENRQAVPYASIQIANQQAVLTDSAGHFELDFKNDTLLQLYITGTGFQPAQKQLRLSETTVTIYLHTSAGLLNEVIVTGVGTGTKWKSTPVAISVVSARELEYHTNTNAIDALSHSVPGLQTITTGPNVSKPSIRGLGYNRVLTLFDGIRQEGQQWADEHGIEADQYNIARAEVIKGPASIAYGSDAVAGVINLIPFIPAQVTPQIKGSILLEHHSNNGMGAASAGLYRSKNSYFWSARGSVKMAKDYRNAVDGWVFNTGFKEWNLSASAGLNKSWGQSYITLTSYNNLQEIPDGSRDSATRKFTRQVEEGLLDDIRKRPVVPDAQLNSYRTDLLHQYIRHYRIFNKTTFKWGNNQLASAIGFSQNVRQEYNHPIVPQQAGLYIVLNTLQFTTSWSKAFKERLNLTMGINGMSQTNNSKNATDFPIPDYQMLDGGAFVTLEKEWNKLTISGGIRYDNRYMHWADFYTATHPATGFDYAVRSHDDTSGAHLAFEKYSKNFQGITGSFGITWTISPHLFVKANMARGYRSPNITEAGANGLDPGAHIYYIGNRNFVPEYNWQQDIGIFVNLPGLEIGMEWYNNQIHNYIYQQKLLDANGQPVEIVPGNYTYGYQQAKARLFGVDGSLKYHPVGVKQLMLQSTVSTVTGINKDEQLLKTYGREARYLPLISPLRVLTAIRWNLPLHCSGIKAPYLRLETDLYAAQRKFYGVQNTETATPAYQLFNAGLGFNISNGKETPVAVVSINAENLLNKVYQSHLNRLKYFEYHTVPANSYSGIYNMGRNVSIKTVFNL